MNDFLWIAFIIIIYLVVIRPMVQGIMQAPKTPAAPHPDQNKKPNTSGESNAKNTDKEYVDYEEVK